MPDDNELPPEMQAAIENAMANGLIDQMDEVVAQAVLVCGMQVAQMMTAEWKPDAPNTRQEMVDEATRLFFFALGTYRDNWIERVLLVLKGETMEVFDKRIKDLREDRG